MNLRLPLHAAGASLVSAHKGLLLDRYLLRDDEDEGWRKELESIVRVNSSHSVYKLAYIRWAT